jgi:outer membrane protein OmpA-like peptidoglycan-associated protein
VLFEFDSARVRSAGRDVIEAIAKMWKSHPEWARITIEGHADVRGPDDYNQDLSQRRAERARDVLLHDGFEAERIAAIGYGRTRPRDDGTTEQAHRRNRRVEFVIVRRDGVEP